MSLRPVSQRSYGGIDWVASSWMRDVSAHVVPLEGVEVAREQLGVGLVDRRGRGGGRQIAFVERRACALERAADRGDARLQQLRHLGRLPAQHFAQDQDRSLPRRQVLQRRDERQTNRLARLGHLGRIPLSATSAGDRLNPRRLRQRVEVRRHRLA